MFLLTRNYLLGGVKGGDSADRLESNGEESALAALGARRAPVI
jgi:hypothetical protein